jgi:hypothetical protein
VDILPASPTLAQLIETTITLPRTVALMAPRLKPPAFIDSWFRSKRRSQSSV